MPIKPGFLELQHGRNVADEPRTEELALIGAGQAPPTVANSVLDGGGSRGDQTIQTAGGPQLTANHRVVLEINVEDSGRDTTAAERVPNTESLSSISLSSQRPGVLATNGERAHPGSEPEPVSYGNKTQQLHRSFPKEAPLMAHPASGRSGPASASRVAIEANPLSGSETRDHQRFLSPAETSSFEFQGEIERGDGSSFSTDTNGLFASDSMVPPSGQIVNGELGQADKSATPEQDFEARTVDTASSLARTSPRFLELQQGRNVVGAAKTGELAVKGADQASPWVVRSVPDGDGSRGDQTTQTVGSSQLAANHRAVLEINVGNSGRDVPARQRMPNIESLSSTSFSSHRLDDYASFSLHTVSSANHDQIGLRASSSMMGESTQEQIDAQPLSKAATALEQELVIGIEAKNSELRQFFGPDSYISRLQQTDEPLDNVDPAGKSAVVDGNELGNRSLHASSSEAVNGTIAIKYDDKTAHEQPIFHNLTIHEQAAGIAAAERSQSVQSNVVQIRDSKVDANKDEIGNFTQKITIGQSGEVIPLNHGRSHSIFASGRRPHGQTTSSSNSDESQGRGSALVSRLQLSSSQAEQQFRADAVSKAYFPKEPQDKRPHGEPGTHSRQSTVGMEQNSDESVRNENSLSPPTAREGSCTWDMPVFHNGLTTRPDEATRHSSNSQFGNVPSGEISRTSIVNPNNATERFHRNDNARETSKAASVGGPLREPYLPKFEKVASLNVELQAGGSVRASIRERSGGVAVRMMTNDSRAAGGLTGEVGGLRTSLATFGLKLQSFQVSYQNGQQQRPADEQPKEDSRSRQHSADEHQIFTIARSDQ
ncbi:MAG: hypothetical protein JO189_09555 [Deltaproteobacteria bacterium]|nr:hypothetical protein [Deltaproteobacteria bacterium]